MGRNNVVVRCDACVYWEYRSGGTTGHCGQFDLMSEYDNGCIHGHKRVRFPASKSTETTKDARKRLQKAVHDYQKEQNEHNSRLDSENQA